MNKLIAGLFGAALISGVAMAGTGAPAPSAKDLSKAVEKVNYVETDVSGVRLNGYVDVGYIYNFTGNSNLSNRFPTDGRGGGDFNVNTVKLTIDKPLSNKNEWQAGFRVDMMFGDDAGVYNTNNLSGSSASEFFLEQAYVVFRAPFGNGLDIKAGKFASYLGYEAAERPANMNITYSQLFTFMPIVMTGVSFEYPISNTLDVGLAVGNGKTWDSNFGNIDSNDGYGAMAKINFKVPGGNANWQNSVYYTWDSAYQVASYGLAYSGLGDKALGRNNNNAVIYDTVFNWAPKFANGKLLLGLNADFGYAQGSDQNYNGTNGSSTLWGAAGYAKYQFTDIFSLAGRVAYVHVDDPSAFNAVNNTLSMNTFARDDWSATITAGFNVVENMVIRVEYRADIGTGSTYGSYTAGNQTYIYPGSDLAHTVAVEAVYTF